MLHHPIARFRERLVLGQVRPLLAVDEQVLVWAHVHAPEDDQPGLLSMTGQRCLLHWSPRDEASASFRWTELTAWELTSVGRRGAVLSMAVGEQQFGVVLPLTTGTRADNATRVVEHVTHHAPPEVTAGRVDASHPLAAQRRGWRGQARRVAVTLAGLLVVLVSAVFASPFVPGPGALTFLAGLAILAKEYDWARDVHHWAKRKFERLWSWLRARRALRRQRRAARRQGAQVRDLAQQRARRHSEPLDLEAAPRAQNE